jgi:hypothetical protein
VVSRINRWYKLRGEAWIKEKRVRIEALKEEHRKQEAAAAQAAKAEEELRKREQAARAEVEARKREQAVKAEEQLRQKVQAAKAEEQERKRKQAATEEEAAATAANEAAGRRDQGTSRALTYNPPKNLRITPITDEGSTDRAFGGKASTMPTLKLHGPKPGSKVYSAEEPFAPKTLKNGKPEASGACTTRSLKGTPRKSGKDVKPRIFVRSTFFL